VFFFIPAVKAYLLILERRNSAVLLQSGEEKVLQEEGRAAQAREVNVLLAMHERDDHHLLHVRQLAHHLQEEDNH
jgi:hypothetical protein